MARSVSQYAPLLSALFSSLASAATQCYFPDGITLSPDVPCNAVSDNIGSPCCSSIAMCMDNGLCFGKGILSRGSCTDKNWGEGCVQYCKAVNIGGGMPIYPCRDLKTWTCGGYNSSGQCDEDAKFEMEGANGFMLRPSQVGLEQGIIVNATTELDLVNATATDNAALATSASTASAVAKPVQDESGKVSTGALVGAVVGVAVPLLLALAGAIFVIRKQRKQLRSVSATSPSTVGDYTQIHQPQQMQSRPSPPQWQESDHSGWSSKPDHGSPRVEELDSSRRPRELSAD